MTKKRFLKICESAANCADFNESPKLHVDLEEQCTPFLGEIRIQMYGIGPEVWVNGVHLTKNCDY